ncbi:helix-turn-helix domain-containing protein [Aeoliella sp. SH292]|uniref:helix-turn-helix domain-containing protein n=1 Tax=Aeoliella sp. SH292 TaxID=3454464 RepID=UPI003F981752
MQFQTREPARELAEHLLTPHEAAEALRISARKLWALKDAGEISHVKIGRLVRYPAASVRKFIADRATTVSPA